MIYIASSTQGKGVYGRPASIARPLKTEPGDVLIAAIGYRSSGVSIEEQSPWRTEESFEYEGIGLTVYGKTAGEDEPDTYDFSGLEGNWTGMIFRVLGSEPSLVYQNLAMDGGSSKMLWSPSLEVGETAFIMAGILAEGSLYSPVSQKGFKPPHVSRISRKAEGLTMSVTTTDRAGGGMAGPWSWRLPEVTRHIGWSIAFVPAPCEHEKEPPIKEKRIGLRRKR